MRMQIGWAGLLTGLLALPVLAQDDAGPADDASDRPLQLDEIVVTAQKREQNIKDVPISVSSISGEQIREGNIENMNDMSKVTPNFKVSADGVYNVIAIRGLGSGVNGGFDQSVGIFIDDVYYASPQRLIAAIFDIERIEILRGPQGTLFGRNTIAGAINMHTGTVDHEWGGYADLQFGELDWNRHTLVLNAPIIEDVIAARIAGQFFRREGHVYDRVREAPNGTVTLRSGRAKGRWTVNDNLDLQLIAQAQDSLGRGHGDQYHHVPEEWLAFFRLFDPETEDRLDDYEHGTNYPAGGRAKTYDINLKADIRLWDHDLVGIIAGSRGHSRGGVDADFGPSPTILGLGGGEADQLNFELRALSEPGTWEYVAGLYYFWNDRQNDTDIVINPLIGTSTAQTYVIPAVAQAVTDGILPDVGPFSSEVRRTVFAQEAQSYAAYGQLTWNVTDNWSLIAGARASIDYKELHFVAEHYVLGVRGFAPVYELLLNAEEFDVMDERDDKSFTPKLSAIYKLTEDINIYGTWAQGFKAGGFNAAALNTESDLQFEPEFSNTYEAGIKGDYFGGRAKINLGLFRTEFQDLQVSIFNGLDFVVDNAAEAISQGVEVDATVILPPGFLIVGTFAYLDAFYESFPGGPCQTQIQTSGNSGNRCDLTGARLAGAPEFQATAAINYHHQIRNLPFDFIIGGDVFWQDDVIYSTDQDPEDAQEAYYLLNGRVGFKDKDERWTFMVFVRNIMDETILISSFDVPLYAGAHNGSVEPPRTVTAHFTVNF